MPRVKKTPKFTHDVKPMGWSEFHSKVFFAKVKLSDLFVNPLIQRMTSPKWVKERLGEAFNPSGIGVLDVNYRKNEGFSVVDGAGRKRLLEEHIKELNKHPDNVWVDVRVHFVPAEEEGSLFLTMNDKRQVTSQTKFNTVYNSGCRKAKFIVNRMKAIRINTPIETVSTDNPTIHGAVLYSIYRDYRRSTISNVMEILQKCYKFNDQIDSHALLAGFMEILCKLSEQVKSKDQLIRNIKKAKLNRPVNDLFKEMQRAKKVQFKPGSNWAVRRKFLEYFEEKLGI